jgi:hypothetical protein
MNLEPKHNSSRDSFFAYILLSRRPSSKQNKLLQLVRELKFFSLTLMAASTKVKNFVLNIFFVLKQHKKIINQ